MKLRLGFWIPEEILQLPKLTSTQKLILAFIHSSFRYQKEGFCDYSDAFIARRLCQTKATVSYSISQLVKLGYLKRLPSEKIHSMSGYYLRRKLVPQLPEEDHD